MAEGRLRQREEPLQPSGEVGVGAGGVAALCKGERLEEGGKAYTEQSCHTREWGQRSPCGLSGSEERRPCVEARNPTIHGARHARTHTSTAVAATQPVATPAKRPALRPWRIDTRRSSSATGASMQAARPRWVASA